VLADTGRWAQAARHSERNEAMQFYQSLATDFDTTEPLRWSFLLGGAAEDRVGSLMESLAGMGFPEIEPMLDEEQQGLYIVWFAEVCVHSADSFAQRVAAVERFAAHEGLVVYDYSADRDG
jgi:hypothetical protein